jgi:uncharacterized membrane protein
VVCAVLAFSVFFIVYLSLRQDAYLTHAEDLGIMDQALWNTLHGSILHQTICNTIGDVNCLGPNGISRLAIHFEPILFPISLLYFLFPSPKTLLVLQTLIVASGAFPAFWLARLRLRNDWAASAIALLYLLYPALQEAVIYDFHAVTLTAAFLLYMLYFMYTRRTLWLFVFALLAMACKEEIPVVVAMFGLWSMLFQHRWRSGAALVLVAFAWTGIGLFIVHHVSPDGHTPLTARYSYLGDSLPAILFYMLRHPVSLLKQHVFEAQHFYYIRTLLTPTGYLAILAPWILVLALPTFALNLLSSDPQMYSGLFQYNAEIVPVLVFATIESLALLSWLARKYAAHSAKRQARPTSTEVPALVHSATGLRSLVSHTQFRRVCIAFILVYMLFSTTRADYSHGILPLTEGFQWPSTSAHTKLAQTFIKRIPTTASVSAQSSLVPHLSHRRDVYLFPYEDNQADYIFLDVTSDIYPFYSSDDYIREAKKLLVNGTYGIVDADDGYLLLQKGEPAPGISSQSETQSLDSDDMLYVLPALPDPFCSYVTTSSASHLSHPLSVSLYHQGAMTPDATLLGFDAGVPKTASISKAYISLTTYWRVSAPTNVPLQLLIIVVDKQGKEHLVSTDVPSVYWCETNTWKPGTIIKLTSRVFSLKNAGLSKGPASLTIALVPLMQPTSSLMDIAARRPMSIQHAPSTVKLLPRERALQLQPLTLIP